MIVVDTSALMAMMLGEPQAGACNAVLATESDVAISAATLAEALIVAARRDCAEGVAAIIYLLGFEVVPVTEASARQVAAAYAQWGRGVHPAGLNFGDCFAYELARERDCPLLFVGADFSKTGVRSALTAPAR
ncbi:MAG: type II toxin-antitoxin system VapC family toxin [Roseiarcus sp.]